MLLAVAIVVLEVIALGLQRIVVFIFDLPSAAPGRDDLQHGPVIERQGRRKGVVIEHVTVLIGGGEFAPVNLQGVISIPQKAVQQLQNIQSVYTVGPDNKVQARPVVTGPKVGDLWIIEQGLEPGDRVIVEGQLKVRPGSLVTPQPYKPKA